MHVDVGKTGTDTPPMSPGAQILAAWEARVQAKVCHGRPFFLWKNFLEIEFVCYDSGSRSRGLIRSVCIFVILRSVP